MKAFIVLLFCTLSLSAFAGKRCAKNDIDCLMKSRVKTMNRCYKRVLKYTKRRLPLSVKVKFEVHKNGDPTNFHFHVSEYHKAVRKGMFTKCLQDAIESIDFPRPRYSSKMFIYRTYNFQRRS